MKALADHITETTTEREDTVDTYLEDEEDRMREKEKNMYKRGTDFSKWLEEQQRKEFNPTGMHLHYLDKNGEDMTLPFARHKIFEKLIGGPTWCPEEGCRTNFSNLYRLYEHILESGHCPTRFGLAESAKKEMAIFQEFEKQYF